MRVVQYYLVAATAVNIGQGSLVVTYAREYSRKSLVPDVDFEGSDSAWTTQSASIVQDSSLAYSGNITIVKLTPRDWGWTPYSVSVTAQGNDILSFVQTDGTVYTLIDNVSLFLGNQ